MRIVLSAAEQVALDAAISPDFHTALVANAIAYEGIKATYRCGGAAVPAGQWFANDPCALPSVIQPPQWLHDVEKGVADVLVWDGLTAISTNPGLLLPVLAASATGTVSSS